MKLHLVAAAVLFAAAPTFAQAPGPGLPGGEPGLFMHGRGPLRELVTNAPYSARFTSTSTQKLQDGTALTHTSTRTVARDSLGRVREEITLPSHGSESTPRTIVVIFDPVAKTVTSLDVDRKIATERTLPEPRAARDGSERPERRGPGPVPQGNGGGPDTQAGGHGPRRDRNNVTRTDLGSKTIAGVVATGSRITRTIPANTMGNADAIVSTHEDWFSPDLKVELSRSDVDPFHGTDMTTVSSLKREEPAPALFKVPDGYTTRTAPQRAFGRRGFGGPGPGGNPPAPPNGM